MSLIATLLFSVAYLGTPGVVWRFGFSIFLNTLVGIAITVVLVLFVTIPYFVATRIPAGLAGAIFAAMRAASMSTIDC